MRELLLITIENQEYGIWKDEVLSVTDVQTLHRLPLSPACVAGISLVDGRTVTLADLPVCIGRASQGSNGKASILMLQGEKNSTGFMVRGEISSFPVPPDALFPVPEYLKTDLIDSCTVRNAVPVPVINALNLSSRIFQSHEELPRPAVAVPDQESSTAFSAIRVFELGGELFAAPSTGMENGSIEPGRVVEFTLVPEFVKGITFHDGSIIPVVDLSQRIKRQKSKSGACMIAADISGMKFGLIADGDRGVLPASSITISDLPPIARSSSIRSAAVKDGQIVPLADLAKLLSADPKDTGEKPLEQRYRADSQFGSLFRTQDVDVVEFLLLGSRHAIPKSEVEDIIPCRPFRHIPDAPEIVIGISEYNGTLLPVLDLAAIFGRRSIATPDWQMVLVKNGDFRALVITQKAFGERRLPLGIQREVPILLPHQVVYGCYPDAEAVRLILNVHAISVHFEKSLLKQLLPALSIDLQPAPAEIAASPLLQTGREAFTLEEAKPVEPVSETVAVQETPTIEPVKIEIEPVEPTVEQTEETEVKQEEQAPEQEEVAQTAYAACFTETDEEQETTFAEPAIASPVSEVETVQEEVETRVEEVEVHEPVSEESVPVVEDRVPAVAEQENVTEESVPVVVETVEKSRVTDVPDQEPVQLSHKQEELHSEPQRVPFSRRQPQSEPETAISTAYYDTPKSKSSGRKIAYAAVAAVIAVLVYFLMIVNSPDIEKAVKEPAAKPAKAEPYTEVAQPVVQKQESPLVLDIPANRPVNIDVYVVVKGDNLWSISERFTGNPFNYPRIAGENKIANPDLIFPGQKIRLIKK